MIRGSGAAKLHPSPATASWALGPSELGTMDELLRVALQKHLEIRKLRK